ncbi:phage head closure protein [Lentilitoribacter sp. EG35]|uniref:phage head closure protein n=1 Tax=Lentilitoribacter sp. EG35 TaxID=3234192 RepID=UPI00345FC8BD
MAGAGKLDRRIIIERNTGSGVNEFNEPDDNWEKFTTVSAERKDVSDSEKISAGQVNATRMSRFVIRSSQKSRTIDAKDRINYDGTLWDIKGKPKETLHGRSRYLEITAIAQAD